MKYINLSKYLKDSIYHLYMVENEKDYIECLEDLKKKSFDVSVFKGTKIVMTQTPDEISFEKFKAQNGRFWYSKPSYSDDIGYGVIVLIYNGDYITLYKDIYTIMNVTTISRTQRAIVGELLDE